MFQPMFSKTNHISKMSLSFFISVSHNKYEQPLQRLLNTDGKISKTFILFCFFIKGVTMVLIGFCIKCWQGQNRNLWEMLTIISSVFRDFSLRKMIIWVLNECFSVFLWRKQPHRIKNRMPNKKNSNLINISFPNETRVFRWYILLTSLCTLWLVNTINKSIH